MSPVPHGHRQKKGGWRFATPVAFGCAGMIFVASAISSDGIDLRPGRNESLASLVQSESDQYQAIQDRAATLSRDVDRLSGQVDDKGVRRARNQATRLEGPAGFEQVSGQGITVTLADAPSDVREESDENINLLIVHQQDIQAVVNAMWRSGAEAITIQGQRLISTTGIKCAGNSVELQGIPYPQPFVIQAVGDPERIQAGIDSDAYLNLYRSQAADPAVQIGWELQQDEHVVAPPTRVYAASPTPAHSTPPDREFRAAFVGRAHRDPPLVELVETRPKSRWSSLSRPAPPLVEPVRRWSSLSRPLPGWWRACAPGERVFSRGGRVVRVWQALLVPRAVGRWLVVLSGAQLVSLVSWVPWGVTSQVLPCWLVQI
ncbi:DUF881 domain-containing protein [Nocardioides alcanivorans]|uniref:DUF881 domain-containing protein n=1 Tax=Nocardioides alcanivorans TaxID=2897352 RepID=UPI001F205287|nr:DUF881 domain-containing protein [Nocardioides alcanivorans]